MDNENNMYLSENIYEKKGLTKVFFLNKWYDSTTQVYCYISCLNA